MMVAGECCVCHLTSLPPPVYRGQSVDGPSQRRVWEQAQRRPTSVCAGRPRKDDHVKRRRTRRLAKGERSS